MAVVQIMLASLAGLAVGLLVGLGIGVRAGYLALRVAARVITAERRDTAASDIQLAA